MELAGALVEGPRPGDLNQALMELGATVCTPSSPRCLVCPLRDDCDARSRGLQDEIPVLAKKKKAPVVKMVALVATRGDSVLLARRMETGLFGGLWEPPMAEARSRTTIEEATRLLADLVGREVTLQGAPAIVKHVLTHRELHLRVYAGAVSRGPVALSAPYEDARFVDREGLRELGISTLAKKVIAAIAKKETSAEKLR